MADLPAQTAFLREGDRTEIIDGDSRVIVVSCIRAFQYLKQHWEPVPRSPYRPHFRYLPTGEVFSPAKLRRLWTDIYVDRDTLLQGGMGRTLYEWFCDPQAVNVEAWNADYREMP